MRIVSLVPSATEILCLLGAGNMLVGRSHECDFPPEVQRVRALTSPTTPVGTPAQIDAAVSRSLAAGESLYRLDGAQLADLRPDLIITQDLRSVCSIDLASVRAVAEGLDPRPRVLGLNPTTIDGVLDDVLRVGEAVGRAGAASGEVVRLRERMNRAAEFVNPYCEGPSVAFIEWTDPLFAGGHWVPQLIERAGGRCPLNPTSARADAGAAAGPQQAERTAGPSIRISAGALVESRPDAIVICPCGVGLESAERAADELAARAYWGELPAVRRGRVAVVDGNQMFSRPGPRLVEAFEWLAGWLNERPELMARGFPWRPYPRANPGDRRA